MNKESRLWGNLRYYSINHFYKSLFGCKVAKIPVDAGFTCPNRDGTLSSKGCLFCSDSGAGDFCSKKNSVSEQLISSVHRDFHYTTTNKWSAVTKYIAYFQAFSSTYASCDILRQRYDEALQTNLGPSIQLVGLDIATRADCIDNEIIDLLCEYNEKTFLNVELGLQTIHQPTRDFYNLGYDMEVFEKNYHALQTNKIRTTLHIILGLPYETKSQMIETVKYISALSPFGIKFHQLMILRGSPLADMNIPVLSQDDYVALVTECISYLNPDITIHRLTGDTSEQSLVAPLWSRDKINTINKINHRLKVDNIWQGKYF